MLSAHNMYIAKTVKLAMQTLIFIYTIYHFALSSFYIIVMNFKISIMNSFLMARKNSM